jgi:hypothetical protein
MFAQSVVLIRAVPQVLDSKQVEHGSERSLSRLLVTAQSPIVAWHMRTWLYGCLIVLFVVSQS